MIQTAVNTRVVIPLPEIPCIPRLLRADANTGNLIFDIYSPKVPSAVYFATERACIGELMNISCKEVPLTSNHP